MEIQDDGYVVYTKREYAAGICFAIPFFLLLPLKLLLAWLNSRNLSIFLFGCGYGGVQGFLTALMTLCILATLLLSHLSRLKKAAVTAAALLAGLFCLFFAWVCSPEEPRLFYYTSPQGVEVVARETEDGYRTSLTSFYVRKGPFLSYKTTLSSRRGEPILSGGKAEIQWGDGLIRVRYRSWDGQEQVADIPLD